VSDPNRPVHERGEAEIEHDREQQQDADGDHDRGRHTEELRDQRGLHEAREPARRDHPERDGHGREQDDATDIAGRQTPAGVEPVADRPAAQRSEAERVPDRQAGERSERNLAVRQGTAGVAHGQGVDPGEADIAACGERRPEREMAERNRPQRREDLAHAVMA
jgi:hypothetical protein